MKLKKSLQGKVIKVNGKKFTVKKHDIDESEGEEKLLLVRQLDRAVREVKTIFDLGYTDEQDVKYPKKLIKSVYELIDRSTGTDVDIAVVATDGSIEVKKVTLAGLSIENPSNYKIEMFDNDHGHIIKINLAFLAKSILLAVEFEENNNKNKEQEPQEQEPQESPKDAPDSDKILEHLDEIFKDILHEKEVGSAQHKSSEKDASDSDKILEHLDEIFKDILHEKTPSTKKNTRVPDIEDILSKILG